ncbi:hypothetical protein EW146_g3612 [Bondarzewia mesenterica]|uniref:Proline dehydrogenase n=1 Tax=Bondarzewia mesenterica TaxID=1095465 RepID=A0A4S4LYV7_9AGAM|nr:hypothetical protein EW146_g3612 [Bondarzewia mesenterica]
MSLRLFRRLPFIRLTTSPSRGVSSVSGPSTASSNRFLRYGLLSGGLLGVSLYIGHNISTIYADHAETAKESQRPLTPISSLIRSYAVYTMCSFPALVDRSPSILAFLTSVPGLKQITEAFVRRTFFAQFVGGDTAHECVPLLESLRAENKGTLFAYSVEVDEAEATGGGSKGSVPVYKQIVQEMIRSIDVAADFEDQRASGSSSAAGRRTWVAVKLSALLPDAQSLVNLSVYLTKARPARSAIAFPGYPRASDLDCLTSDQIKGESPLTEQDIHDIKDLHSDLVKICSRAQERDIRIIIDAEYRHALFFFIVAWHHTLTGCLMTRSWYQPAIDAMTLSLMRQFNKLPDRSSSEPIPVRPLIYATFQAYLRRNLEYLEQSLKDAKAGNYALGVKLVRGAYHPHETIAHETAASGHNNTSLSISPDPHPPVWPTKPETDACYNATARRIISSIRDDIAAHHPVPTVGVLFGSHNWESCDLVLDELVKQGLARREKQDGREVVSMGDEVTERVALGQLFGMSDELTDYLVDKTRSSSPFVIKYVPYGALSEVMPYLSRRAIENKSMLGGGQAAAERRRAWAEIRAPMVLRTAFCLTIPWRTARHCLDITWQALMRRMDTRSAALDN